jgi:hypothetical protein
VEEAGDVPLGVLLGARLLELAGEDHLLVHLHKYLIGQDRPQSRIHACTSMNAANGDMTLQRP